MKRLAILFATFSLTLSSTLADEYQQTVEPLLKKYCVRCHGPEKQNAQIRYDNRVGYEPADAELWTAVYEAIELGDMPPEDEPQPTVDETKRILAWIARSNSEQAGRPLQRRLNRREFSAALRDLTGLPIDFAAGLSDDSKTDGFDTGALALQDAADSVAQQLEVTRRAVESIRILETNPNQSLAVDFREHEFNDFKKFVEQHWKDQRIFTKSKRLNCKKGVGVYLPTQWTGDRGNSFLALPMPSDKRAALTLKLRVVAKRPLPGLPAPTLWVKIGGKYLDYVSVGDQPQVLTYAVRAEDHLVEDGVMKIMLSSFVEMPYAVKGFENDDRSKPEDRIPGGIGVYRPAFDRKTLRTPEVQPVPSIVIETIEIDYDHKAVWPPEEWNVATREIADNDQSAHTLIAIWMQRAWRRPVSESEQAKFMTLYQNLRGQDFSFDDALRATFQSVLMGGSFRYLASPANDDLAIAQHAIASRLSFMLTGSPPDTELRRLATEGRLREPKTLDAQVDRLIDDARSDAFFRPFVLQWLNMEQPITLTMSHFKKQDFKFGRHLKDSMKEETIEYIARIFRENRPAEELIDSDWTMMNDILAVHYGYDSIDGGAFRKVKLNPDSSDRRGGGVLGHAGIQSMLCWMGDNWVIYRGSWILDRVLDDPPPPPPLEVPELSPFEKRHQGKSFRELLVQHQADSKCSICHQKMDPLGFAFQNFDLSGRWRDVEYERYVRNELDGKIEWRGEGKTRPVDAEGRLPKGETFTSFEECKRLLVKNYMDEIVYGLLKKLTLFGTGRTPNISDRAVLRRIIKEQSQNDYAMRDLLKALIRSEVFLETPPTTGVSK